MRACLVVGLATNVCKSLADKLHQPLLLFADVKIQYESACLENFVSLRTVPHLQPSCLRQKFIGVKKKGKRERGGVGGKDKTHQGDRRQPAVIALCC